MAEKRPRVATPSSRVIRDNVPAGFVVSLDGVSPLRSFATLFRDELLARGVGASKGGRGARPGVD